MAKSERAAWVDTLALRFAEAMHADQKHATFGSKLSGYLTHHAREGTRVRASQGP